MMTQKPNRSPTVTQLHQKDRPATMNFATALEQMVDGKRVRRLEWEDEGVYLVFDKEMLAIFKTEDRVLHPLLVSTGDVVAEDWVIVREDQQ